MGTAGPCRTDMGRVFLTEPDKWVLKGATALLARMRGSGRHTVDVDLYRRRAGLGEAEAALRAAAALELGDFFRFELSPGRRVTAGVAPRVAPAAPRARDQRGVAVDSPRSLAASTIRSS